MNNEKIEKELAGIDNEILSDLRKDLEAEISKPENERDEDFITELREMIAVTENEVINDSKEHSFESVMKMLDEHNNSHNKKFKNITFIKRFSVLVATACFMFVVGQNTKYMNAFSGKPLPENCKVSGNFVVVDDVYDESWLTDDPYGMKAECAKHNMFPDTPYYIPEDFELEETEYVDNGICESMHFLYKKKISFPKTQL